ncbi:hypothetical protein ACI1TN_09130 [Lactococcus garvieae]|uniref:hypothetical protein n=1 Tax=Lactococcus garvieae TaxID=1363 RepID=UPI003852A770
MGQNAKTTAINENKKVLDEFLQRYPKTQRAENGGIDFSATERNNITTMISIYRIDKLTLDKLNFILNKFTLGDTYPNIREWQVLKIMEDAKKAGIIE